MPLKPLRATLSLALALVVTSCHAQSAPRVIPPELAHRIEATLRSKVELPPGTTLELGTLTPSTELPGYDRMDIHYHTLDGNKGSIQLLLSKDGKKLAQFNSYDISVDPKVNFKAGDRPPRGGTADSPVLIVGYDDLECPFCAKMNAQLFPALLDRYKDQVRIVYRSFPIEQHPWALRAAVDTDCLGAQSAPGYWAAVDTIHAGAATYGGTEHSLAKAEEEIDNEVRHEGLVFHTDIAKLDACILKQDTAPELASLHAAEEIGVRSTPTLFINGLKVEGAVPLSYFFGLVDDALRAEGKTPPPPYVEPAPAAPATTAAPAAKPAGR